MKPGGSGTIRITVRGDLALITDDRVGRYWKWMGQEVEPTFLTDKPYIRATMGCLREGGAWKMMHAHFSRAERQAAGPGRPRVGQVVLGMSLKRLLLVIPTLFGVTSSRSC